MGHGVESVGDLVENTRLSDAFCVKKPAFAACHIVTASSNNKDLDGLRNLFTKLSYFYTCTSTVCSVL